MIWEWNVSLFKVIVLHQKTLNIVMDSFYTTFYVLKNLAEGEKKKRRRKTVQIFHFKQDNMGTAIYISHRFFLLYYMRCYPTKWPDMLVNTVLLFSHWICVLLMLVKFYTDWGEMSQGQCAFLWLPNTPWQRLACLIPS